MALIASGSGEDKGYEEVPIGAHKAICYKLIDGGTAEEEYQGEVSIRHKIFMFWEMPELRMADDRPMSIFKEYTFSLHPRSNLHKDVSSWRNCAFSVEELAAFDLTQLLGKGCKLTVGRTSGDKAKVTQIHSLPSAFDDDENLRNLPTVNPQEIFDLEDYCKEFTGASDEKSKIACDILDSLPWFISDRVAGHDGMERESRTACLEVEAAKSAGSKSPVKKKAAAKKKPATIETDDDFDDDIPF
tara:strand:- start:86 stop:817 length:732 start_codon:yes stop_codon:yes gene_type:complete